MTDLPAPVFLDVIYALVAEDTKEAREQRERIDAALDRQSTGGKPDRATWGKLPAHQRAMQAAATA